jgi:transcriptional regulator with XRE-family HTH domain
MDWSRQDTLAALIKRYRLQLGWSQEDLAEALGCDHSYVSLLESGKRSVSLKHAARLDNLFPFSPEDRDRFYAITPLADLQDPEVASAFADYQHSQKMHALLTATEQAAPFRSLFAKARYLPHWARARVEHLRCDMRRAVPRYEFDVVPEARQDARGEFLGIILLDAADAYGVAGRLKPAEAEAVAAELVTGNLTRDVVKNGLARDHTFRRLQMGWARTIVLQLELAYLRGDEIAMFALYEKARKPLEDAQDHYGWAKSYYFLALWHFHHGELIEAEGQARRADWHAEQIAPEDIWWKLRDGLFLGGHWWRVHTTSLVLDILAHQPDCDTAKVAVALEEYRRAWAKIRWWVRKLPPFVPRRWWSIKGLQTDRVQQEFERWSQQADRLNYMIYKPDILLAWGDWMRDANGDRVAARGKYAEVLTLAERLGFGLMAAVAERRLAALEDASPAS